MNQSRENLPAFRTNIGAGGRRGKGDGSETSDGRKTGGLIMPDEKIFSLPEKVLQFGTGVLLRGLPDYFIDKANRQGLFNGRIVVVKSTDGGDSAAFDKQDGLYTLCV